MSEFFLKLVNMSICAGWLVPVVLVLRLVLKKAPKWVSVLLWSFVAIRLICPYSVESVLSLIPSAQTVSPEIMLDWTPEISSGIGSIDSVVNPIISEVFAPEPIASANPLQLLIPVASVVWLAGVVAMLIYAAVSYLLLRRRVATAVRLRENIFQSENVASAFVLGILKPRIYLPFQTQGLDLEPVIAHEQSHIRRKDHWWKPLGFLLLAIHWFNPLIWLGYTFLCRDIELACDEKVIKEMDSESKAAYTQALVACSVDHRSITACPLAFGEVGVKARVKSVLHYKKPGFWIIVAAIAVCAAVAVCFLTDPVDQTGAARSSAGSAENSPDTTLVLVGTISNGRMTVLKVNSIEQAISVAISLKNSGDRFPDMPKDWIPTQAYTVLGIESKSGTPLYGQTNHMEETTVYVQYAYYRYAYSNGKPEPIAGIGTPARITFTRNSEDRYTVKEFWEPDPGSAYAQDVRDHFPKELADQLLDPDSGIVDTEALSASCLEKAQKYASDSVK